MKDEKTLKMYELPTSDRPYEKMELVGPKRMSETELLSIILCSGKKGRTALDLARHMVVKIPEMRDMADLSLEELQLFPGVGRVKAIRLKAAFELGMRSSTRTPLENKPLIRSAADAIGVMEHRLRDLPREEFHVLLLDVRCRLIRTIKISGGSLAATSVYPRDIFREALKANASAVILCHNHPSGDSQPSGADIDSSNRIAEMGVQMGVQVLDHIIIGADGSTSLKEKGYFLS